MKRAVDELMCLGPPLEIERLVHEHESNGMDVVLRWFSRRLPTSVIAERNGSSFILENILYLKATLVHNYILIDIKTPCGFGSIKIRNNACRNYFGGVDNFCRFTVNINPTIAFSIIEDHRDYPIWSARRAVIATFLLPLLPELLEIIAKMVWASRRDRSVWWPIQ